MIPACPSGHNGVLPIPTPILLPRAGRRVPRGRRQGPDVAVDAPAVACGLIGFGGGAYAARVSGSGVTGAIVRNASRILSRPIIHVTVTMYGG
jgi:hypothetical protein